ncbi:hypothetical protein [Sphingomonas sp.]|uniref:hypothetical protein n=1 Tax=Sphingomonas sp. TaxID=28214 RepID=UPI000DAF56DA|nr:hypothetical protein [Sphingomonas sp.]PZU09080.1 MAG: hypothetical protein DI605_09865 [Sphingomonas sp.]
MALTRLGHVAYTATDAATAGFKTLPWVDEVVGALQSYRDQQPSAEDLARVDNYQVTPLEYFKNPHLRVRALENEAGHMFRNMIAQMDEHLDEEMARTVAYAAGLAHGKRRMSSFMNGQKLDGGPEAMAKMQDTGHSAAGPRHTTALFAHYNDQLVEVARTEDSYGAHTGKESPATSAFFDGFIDGYMATDPKLVRIEELHRDRPDGRTEFVHRFWYAPGD